MPMSASRISPVRGSTWRGPTPPKTGRAVGIHRIDAWRVSKRLEIGVVGLDLGLQRVLEARLLERLVPFEHAVDDRLPILVGDVAVDPENDRFLGFRERGRRILFLEPPALDQVDLGRQRGVVAVVEALLHEVADAVVGDARAHRLLGQLGDVVVEAEEEAADIRDRRRWRRGEIRSRGRLAHALQGIVGVDVDRDQVGRCARLRDRRISRVERIGLPIGALEQAVGARVCPRTAARWLR